MDGAAAEATAGGDPERARGMSARRAVGAQEPLSGKPRHAHFPQTRPAAPPASAPFA